jgi:protein TonB
MIRGSRLVLIACAGAALMLHGAGLWLSGAPARIEVAGGAGAMEATLGSSFADMVTGAALPVSESAVTLSRRAEAVVKPVAPQMAPRPDTSRAVIAAVPNTATVAPMRRPVVARERADDLAPVRPASATVAAAATAQDVIVAQPEREAGVQVSRRPLARPRTIEETAARQSPEPERRATRPRSEQGNTASRDARRGSVAGAEAATATQQGRDTSRRSEAQGNAAASNYPGEVMRHLARVPRPHAEARGVVMVRFSIAPGGRLVSVGVVQSSGSTRLDRAALTVVQRAAPFPAPPDGAQTSFFIKIAGR